MEQQEYLKRCLKLLAEEVAQEVNNFRQPTKPHTGDGKCAPGFKKNKKNQCVKVKKGY
jgi:hypothetical protein